MRLQDIEDDSDAPVVDGEIIASADEDFGGDIPGSATGGGHEIVGDDLGQAEIGDLDDGIGLGTGVEEVFGFEISVDDSHGVAI